MRVEMDLTYDDLGLAQPEGGLELVGDFNPAGPGWHAVAFERKVACPKTDEEAMYMRPLIDRESGQLFTFKTKNELANFKYQRYMQRYLRTIQ